MKKKVMFVSWIFSMLLMTFPCAAKSEIPVVTTYYWSFHEYESLLEQKETALSENFVYYDEIASVFGEFCGYRLDTYAVEGNYPAYSFYYVMDENQVVFRIRAEKSEYEPGNGENSNLTQISDMRDLRGTAHDQEASSRLTVDGFSFEYKYGQLDYIEFGYKGWYVFIDVEVGGMNFCDYPHLGENTLMMRLLNPETTASSIQEIYAKIDGAVTSASLGNENGKQLLTICLSALGGAAVAAVTTWLVTYFIMRKRRDVPAVTALEVGAEADGTPPDTPPTP